MKTENISTLKIHKLTQEQYERELSAGNIDETALYFTPDDDDSIYVGDDVVESAVPINADTLHGYTYEQIISLAGGLPVGSVILWDGDKVPTGWELVEEVTLD